MTTKLIGKDDLARKIRALPDAVKREIRAAMEKGANEIVAMMKNLVPVDSGDLRNSIGWTYGAAPAGSLVVKTIAGPDDLRITIFAGNEAAYYARFVEFGTQGASRGQRVADTRRGAGYTRKSYRTHPGTAAQPFFFPAYRAFRPRVKRRISRAINSAAKKVAAGG